MTRSVTPVEIPVDRDTAPWWEATRERRLLLQSCSGCGHVQHPPRSVCTGCGSVERLGWTPAGGRGTVESWSEVHRAPSAGFTPPYTIALVRLEEGPVLLTRLLAPAGCDDPVVLDWDPLPDGRALPVFAPSSAG